MVSVRSEARGAARFFGLFRFYGRSFCYTGWESSEALSPAGQTICRREDTFVAAESKAECTWNGNLVKGNGTITVDSGTFGPLPVTWTGRTQRSKGATSPEELIAAALASCWCMATAHGLTERGTPPTTLDATAEVT